jgi:hypothetical protein
MIPRTTISMRDSSAVRSLRSADANSGRKALRRMGDVR